MPASRKPTGPPSRWKTSLGDNPRKERTKTRTLYVDEDTMTRSMAKAEELGMVFTAVLKTGWARFMAGLIEPKKQTRYRAAAGVEAGQQKKSPTTIRVRDSEWQPLVDWCREETVRRGWRVTPSRLATQYLREEFLEAAPPAEE